MTDKGAIKKTTTPRTHYRSASTHKLGVRSSSQSIDDFDFYKDERRDKRRESQIIDLRASGDRVLRTSSALPSKYTLPDKNPVRLKQLNQNELLSPRSSLKSDYQISRKKEPVKTKSESTIGSNSYERAKSSSRKSLKDRTQSYYNEKRGESSIYAPKDAADKLSSFSKSLENRRSREKIQSASTEKPRLSSRERRKSRTLSPSEVKVLNSKINQEKLKASRYSTDKDISKFKSGLNGYKQDDFEDYDSELDDYLSGSQIGEETDNSEVDISLLEPIELKTEPKKRVINSALIRKTEDEHMLDSGHFEYTEAKKRAAMVESLMASRVKTISPPPSAPDLKKSTNRPYREEKQSENKSLPSSTDEGFEDSQSGDFIKSSPISQVNTTNEKRPRIVKKSLKKRTRGQILMSMIKLDTVEVSIYEAKPIPYDDFIRSFGKFNTQQIYTQTNEDNIEVETQTEVNEVENKWTQFPVTCRNNLKTSEDVKMFKIEHIGVGGDKLRSNTESNPSYDVLNLNEFLSRAGKLMLALLEEQHLGGNIIQNENHDFPFSEGCIKLSVNSLSFLCGRQVNMLHYSEINNKILMSIHAPSREKISVEDKQSYIKDCCIGCVWNVNEPSRPIKLFYSQNLITACCFHCTNNNIVFAGLQDGSICLWDLQEEEIWHQRVVDKTNEMDWIIRSPTYTTSGNWEIESHSSPVVAIRIVSKMDQDETENLNDKFVSIQICSLDEEGKLIIWSVLRNLSQNIEDLGLTQWGKVKLVKSQEVPLIMKKINSNNLKKEFVDMNVDSSDSNNLFLATSGTEILYANCIGGRNNIPCYKINEMDSCGSTTCIEICPFKKSFFFAGCKDGSIRLHSLNIETPILKLKDENSSAGIKSIQWSRSKPLLVYVLDDHHSISVWDLSNSDICPSHKINTKSWGSVKCMKLSSCNTNRDMMNQYLALGTDMGYVEIHKLKKNYYHPERNDLTEEMNTFLRYVSIL